MRLSPQDFQRHVAGVQVYIAVGPLAAQIITTRNGVGLYGDATQRGKSWSQVRAGASGRWRSNFASGCSCKRPWDICVIRPKIPRRKPRRLEPLLGSWAKHESSPGPP